MSTSQQNSMDSERLTALWQRGIVRALALLLLMGMLVVHYMVLHVGGTHPTTFRFVIGMLALPAALVFFVLALSPRFVIDRIWRWGTSLAQLTELTQPCRSRGWGIGLMAAGWASYLTLLGVYLSTPNDPNVGDQGTYLATADWINAHGGLRALPGKMISGEYAEANRHPLFIAILSLMPRFTAGRFLSAGFGIVTLVLLGAVVARRYGLFTAGVLTILLGTNKLFLLSTSRVVCESLLGLLCAWLWWRTTDGFRCWILDSELNSEAKRAARSKFGNRSSKIPLRLAELGVVAGLVWLTKGTGLLMLAGLIAWWLWQARRQWSLMVIGCTLLAAMFSLTSSLLIVRNVVRFGEPFYNVNTLLLFSDRFEQMYEMADEGVMPGEAARRYLETHTATDLLKRGVAGMIWEKFILLRSLGPAPWGDGRVLAGGLLAVLAVGVLLFRREFRRSALLPWLVILIPMFGWYVTIAAGDRFVVPLIPGMMACASLAISLLTERLRPWWSERMAAGVVSSALILWAILAVVITVLSGPNEFAPG